MDVPEALRRAGLRVTSQRVMVLETARGHPHATAEEIAQECREHIGAISTQAVYDCLDALTRSGLLRRIQPAGSAARYEDRVDDNHHHLVCRSCGRVDDVDCAATIRPCLEIAAPRGYAVDEAEITFWGECPRCLRRRSRGSP